MVKIALCVVLLLLPLTALPQDSGCLCNKETIGNNIPLVTDPGFQHAFSASFSPPSCLYLLLYNNGETPGQYAVKAVLFDSAGVRKGEPLTLSTGNYISHQVVFNGQRQEFFATWWGGSTLQQGNDEIWGQLISSTGGLIGQPKRLLKINEPSSFTFEYPGTLLYVAKHRGYVLPYVISNKKTYESKLFLARFNEDGLKIGKSILVTKNVFGGLDLAYDADADEFLLGWTFNDRVYYQILSGGLKKIGTNRAVSSEQRFESEPNVVDNPALNQFAIFWRSCGSCREKGITVYTGGGTSGIVSTEVRPKKGINARTNRLTDGYILLYHRLHHFETELSFARLDENLNLLKADIPVACQILGVPYKPFLIVFNPVQQEYLAIWSHSLSEGGMDIFAQRIRAVPKSGTCQ